MLHPFLSKDPSQNQIPFTIQSIFFNWSSLLKWFFGCILLFTVSRNETHKSSAYGIMVNNIALELLLAWRCKTAKAANFKNHILGVSMCRDVHLWFLFSQPPNELINWKHTWYDSTAWLKPHFHCRHKDIRLQSKCLLLKPLHLQFLLLFYSCLCLWVRVELPDKRNRETKPVMSLGKCLGFRWSLVKTQLVSFIRKAVRGPLWRSVYFSGQPLTRRLPPIRLSSEGAYMFQRRENANNPG